MLLHQSRKTRLTFPELSKAFRLVKNNIGHNWKDLARTLPYGDEKDLSEIDIEIRAIEYANRGQLKEQAYQSLLKWYNHTGKRASVELLTESLRDIKQHRLADTIEMEVVQKTEHNSETEITQWAVGLLYVITVLTL